MHGTVRRGIDERIPRIYDALRISARRQLRGPARRVMRPTILIHETFLRLTQLNRIEWRGDSHLLAVARIHMRRVLIDHIRAERRRGNTTSLPPPLPVPPEQQELAMQRRALDRLSKARPRVGDVARLRVEEGLSCACIAQKLGVSERTVRNDWRFARSWLCRQLGMSLERVRPLE